MPSTALPAFDRLRARSGRSGTNERSLPAFQREVSFFRGVRSPASWAAPFRWPMRRPYIRTWRVALDETVTFVDG
jgi:hypothetical protein